MLKTVRFILVSALYVLIGVSLSCAEDYGKFLDPLNVQLLDDGRKMKLLEDYRYQAPSNEIWKAPNGWVVDGASIPRVFWSIIGGPLEGSYRNASVVHDYYCDAKSRSWQDTHLTFYYGMRASGAGELTAKVMYYAVYKFGPRWKSVTQRDCMTTNGRRVCRLSQSFVKAAPTPGGKELREVESLRDRLAASRVGPKISIEELEKIADQKKWDAFPSKLR